MAEEKKKHDPRVNLIPLSERTPEERREIARKGGLARQEGLRRKKTLRQELEIMLAIPSVQKEICAAIVEQAKAGSVSAFATIRDTVGEKPKTEIDAELSPANMIHDLAELTEEEREFIGQHYGENTPLWQSIARSLSMNARQQLLGELLE